MGKTNMVIEFKIITVYFSVLESQVMVPESQRNYL